MFRVRRLTLSFFLWRFLLTTLSFLIPEINSVLLIKKEKKKRETKKVLIGILGYLKSIASLSVELSSCYRPFSGMYQDKIPPPHQVRSTVQVPLGLCACPLKLEQSSTCPRLLLSHAYPWHQDKWRGHYQTLDHNVNACKLPFFFFLASPWSQTVPAFQNCWEKR